MSTTTTNYGLIKPDTSDPILIGQLNDNADIIDATLKSLSDVLDVAKLGIKYKGEVNYYADLPNNAEIGDAYTVKYAGSSGTTPDGTEYVWGTVSGTNQWINFSKDSYTKAEVDALLALKQNALSSAQLAAVNSGIDSTKVGQIATNENNILFNTNNGVKNIYEITNVPTASGVTITKIDTNTVSLNGTFPSMTYVFFTLSTNNVILPAGDWVVFTKTTGTIPARTLTISSNVVSATLGSYAAFSISEAKQIGVFVQFFTNDSVNGSISIMICPKSLYEADPTYQPYAMSNVELTAAIQAIQAQLAGQ